MYLRVDVHSQHPVHAHFSERMLPPYRGIAMPDVHHTVDFRGAVTCDVVPTVTDLVRSTLAEMLTVALVKITPASISNDTLALKFQPFASSQVQSMLCLIGLRFTILALIGPFISVFDVRRVMVAH